MAGRSGEKMKRATNVKKKSSVTIATVPTTARNGCGVGHALAMVESYQVRPPERASWRLMIPQ
jgi:hypothetical protein